MDSPFLRVREDVRECLAVMGAAGDEPIDGIIVVNHSLPPDRWTRIPFFAPPKLNDDVEREIVEALREAGGPLQQKEIATAAGVSQRMIERKTPDLVTRGVIRKHPTLGFYLPGQKVQ